MKFHQYQKKFIAYAKSYLTGCEEFDRNILLKLSHTQRVYSFAEAICLREHYSGFDENTSLLAALFHDVSRFEQFKRYQTYRDSEEFDHGNMSEDILRSGIFDFKAISTEEFECVALAVRLHNKRVVPEDSAPAVLTVRDADKLDVLEVVLDELDNPRNPKVLYSLSTENRFSERVISHIMNRTSPLHSDLETVNDFVISKVAWVYDLNTATAKVLFKEAGYLGRLRKHLPSDDAVDTIFCDVKNYLCTDI